MTDYHILEKIFPPVGEVPPEYYDVVNSIMLAVKEDNKFEYWDDAGFQLMRLAEELNDDNKKQWASHFFKISFALQNRNRKTKWIGNIRLSKMTKLEKGIVDA